MFVKQFFRGSVVGGYNKGKEAEEDVRDSGIEGERSRL